MKRISIDTHILIWGVREFAEVGQEDMIEKTKAFLAQCRKEGTEIIVTAIVLGEFLTDLDPQMHQKITEIIRSAFIVVPFDSAASAIFAKLWRDRQSALKQIKEETKSTRAALKADSMIVASSIAHQAEAIYSHDNGLRKFAATKIPVNLIPSLAYQHPLELEAPANG
jgi:predicted nucleic acid-binding protein